MAYYRDFEQRGMQLLVTLSWLEKKKYSYNGFFANKVYTGKLMTCIKATFRIILYGTPSLSKCYDNESYWLCLRIFDTLTVITTNLEHISIKNYRF